MNRRHRLRGHRRFGDVRRAGVAARQGVVRVRAQPNRVGVARSGIAVQGARTAVERNRARRRLRATLGSLMPSLPAIDLVITVPGQSNALPAALLAGDVQTAVRAAATRCARS